MSKGKAALFIVTCWMTTFMAMWQMGEIIVANDLYAVFPDDAGLITAMLSWPTLFTAAGSLIAGALLKRLSTKAELLISGISGLVMIAAPRTGSMLILLICSLIAGTGAGFANTAGMSILSEVFIDEKLRSKHMGLYNAAMAAIGAACSYVAGIAAVNDWQGAFIINWLAVPMIIMSLLFLPDIRPEERAGSEGAFEDANGADQKKGFGAKFWIFFISTFLFMVSYVPLSTLVSVYIAENNFGTTAFSGTCSSLGTVGSFCMGLLFGVLYGKLHRKITLLVTGLDIVLYLLAIFIPGKITVALVSLLLGASYGAIMSLLYAYASEIVPISQNGMAMGLMTLDYSLAVTVGVYVYQFLLGAMGGLTPTLWVSLGICAVVFLIEMLSAFAEKKA